MAGLGAFMGRTLAGAAEGAGEALKRRGAVMREDARRKEDRDHAIALTDKKIAADKEQWQAKIKSDDAQAAAGLKNKLDLLEMQIQSAEREGELDRLNKLKVQQAGIAGELDAIKERNKGALEVADANNTSRENITEMNNQSREKVADWANNVSKEIANLKITSAEKMQGISLKTKSSDLMAEISAKKEMLQSQLEAEADNLDQKIVAEWKQTIQKLASAERQLAKKLVSADKDRTSKEAMNRENNAVELATGAMKDQGYGGSMDAPTMGGLFQGAKKVLEGGEVPPAETPPANLVQEGKVTTFKNGESWTKKDGKLLRVN